jgi:hypothetical protein
MKVVVQLIRESKENEEILRLFLRIFNTRNDIYRSDDRLDYHRIIRHQFYCQEESLQKQMKERKPAESQDESKILEEGEIRELESNQNASNETPEEKEELPLPNPYPFVELDPTDIATSIFYLMNVNRFGTLGGYDAITERITSSSPKLSCKDLAFYLKVIDSTKYALKHSYLVSLSENLFSLTHRHILNFTHNEYREQSLEDIMESLNLLASLARYAFLFNIVESIDQFKLEMCSAYIQLPYFDARLKGIEYITSIITSAQGQGQGQSGRVDTAKATANRNAHNNDQFDSDDWDFGTNPLWKNSRPSESRQQDYTYFSSRVDGNKVHVIDYESSPPPLVHSPDSDAPSATAAAAALITVQYMVKWIEDNSIVEKIFQLEHPEAIRQGAKIIVFVARESTLSSKLLEAIWAAGNLHESLQSVIFKLIIDLMDFLSLPQVDFIFEKISQVPVAEYNSPSLVFISDFTRRALRIRSERNAEEKLYGFDIFWNILMFSSQSGTDRYFQAVKTEAIELLERLLLEFETQKTNFMDRCISSLQAGVNVEISLTLLHKIIETLRYTERGGAIMNLEEKHLLDSVLTYLEKSSGAKSDVKSINIIFEFLKYILTQSPLMISEDQVEKKIDYFERLLISFGLTFFFVGGEALGKFIAFRKSRYCLPMAGHRPRNAFSV